MEEEITTDEKIIIDQVIIPAIIAFQEQNVDKSVNMKGINEYIEKTCKQFNLDQKRVTNYIRESYENRREDAKKQGYDLDDDFII